MDLEYGLALLAVIIIGIAIKANKSDDLNNDGLIDSFYFNTEQVKKWKERWQPYVEWAAILTFWIFLSYQAFWEVK